MVNKQSTSTYSKSKFYEEMQEKLEKLKAKSQSPDFVFVANACINEELTIPLYLKKPTAREVRRISHRLDIANATIALKSQALNDIRKTETQEERASAYEIADRIEEELYEEVASLMLWRDLLFTQDPENKEFILLTTDILLHIDNLCTVDSYEEIQSKISIVYHELIDVKFNGGIVTGEEAQKKSL